ncbi:hypothetical protein MJO28_009693 [Puccinia striiformis f. sp. tritici]|uniref:Very-long-chain (3R)-3-hydroxyacyl-CoA dehydratase n=3 Tax=Puccinia striiformis f. sp. tritici TaxID=168172 RepID=A0A0L0V6W1_9BASI|nr:hypothetical protein Pst134EA_017459 [Puccinia striiformis f. sp. tritici]KAI9607349.1 hypothetical protein H4Q26_005867 [Puccinia striiformis f. sp. tritici PST-130]KNE94744.1 hypothetical protein PSTG_11932 [Puccinia striiformis f. sp. tritici PST-78]KAH9461149.1 hypothetical protein Pst134EA_017459 [Puccinia striiformis f. sp. tritici]KAI7947785.1 hypothetical protein MJO28_009693 [Puccinia striiformis f. sp. tritici]KNE94745.1 hypothetical protein, variant [Puccinia striiformis f. sp. t
MAQSASTGFAPISRPSQSDLRTKYLLIYNLLSCFAWAWILERVISELFLTHSTPGSLAEVISRAGQIDQKLGRSIKLIQSCAALEVLHALLNLVRSGVLTTLMQVSSRLWIVLVILPAFPEVGKSPIYASMVLAWSCTEVIRYAHYAFGLVDIKSGVLEWLRYSTFYVLYPIGAGSEAAVMFLAFRAAKAAELSPIITYTIISLVCIWPPALAVMMKHMSRQRKKYLNQKRQTKVA